MATKKTTYRVEHSSLDGRWSEGTIVSEADLRDYDVDRLKDLGAIRKATPDEEESNRVLEAREKTARVAAEEADRTPEEIEADVDAQSTTGNPVL